MARNLDRVGGIAQARQGVSVPINRRNMRFIDGGGLTWSLVDDSLNDEVEVSATAGGASAPTGAIMDFAGTVVPSGWLECNGTAYGRTGGDPSPQVALFAAIGTTWGPGDGSTTYNVPNFARRTRVGRGGTGTGTLGNAVGNIGGEEAHVQTASEMANHGHSTSGGSHSHGTFNNGFGNSIYNDNSTFNGGTGSGTGGFPGLIYRTNSMDTAIAGQTSSDNAGVGVNNNGSSDAANVIQPSAVVMKIIKT